MKRENENNRLNRINEELKREISNIINYEVTNSNVTGMVSVTSVKISPDLRYAMDGQFSHCRFNLLGYHTNAMKHTDIGSTCINPTVATAPGY